MVMPKKSLQFLLVAFVACIPLIGFSNSSADSTVVSTEHSAATEVEKKFNATDLINSHIGDSHEFHVADWNGHPISFYLPVILWTDSGLEIFSSENFHHDNSGTHIAAINGQEFVRNNEIIFYKNKYDALTAKQKIKGAFEFDARPLDFSITKNVFSMFLSVIIMLLLFLAVARSYKKNPKAPKGIAGFLEPLITFVRDDIARPNIGEKKYAKYMPYLLTIFFFIWINNLIGLIPFFPFSSNLTGNIYFTFVMALITFIITIFSANKAYWGHIFSTPGVPVWLAPIMIPVELIGMFTKPFALMIRLFANITAGHIIILSLFSLIFIFETVAVSPISGAFVLFMMVLELLVAALQAYVFTLLSALFIGQAVAEHDHH
jgi:F-type H+-transporting ATPase subunit a